jgi:hypothetical protein
MPSVALRIALPITMPGPLSAHQLLKVSAGAGDCVESGAVVHGGLPLWVSSQGRALLRLLLSCEALLLSGL